MPNRVLHLVLVFGLDDDKHNLYGLLAPLWKRQQVHLYPIRVGWRDGGGYSKKQQAVLDLVDRLRASGERVGLVGISAGASLVVNVYRLRPQLAGVVAVCGALRLPRHLPPRFAGSVNSSAAFRESLEICEKSQRQLTADQLEHIMVVEPWLDFVPVSTMRLLGAKRQGIASVNHSISIVAAMLLYRRRMIRFLEAR
jgi:pimeloyl-ACP methyl ester carboxylesterase